MTRASQRAAAKPVAAKAAELMGAVFGDVMQLIRGTRQKVTRAANAAIIDLCWRIGQYLHHKIEADGWAKGTVAKLAACIAQREPGRLGFSAQNLWRMRQFFQAYSKAWAASSKLSALLREIP